jgi:hypothetical protein
MTTAKHSPAPWDADGGTVFYATPDEADAMQMIEIRANVTEAGWDTVAFIESTWRGAKANAALIKAAPKLLHALKLAERLINQSGMQAGECHAVIRAAITEATQQ